MTIAASAVALAAIHGDRLASIYTPWNRRPGRTVRRTLVNGRWVASEQERTLRALREMGR